MKLTKVGKWTLFFLILALLAVGLNFWPLGSKPEPLLRLSVGKKNPTTGLIQLSVQGGNGTPVVFMDELTGETQLDSTFKIPRFRRDGRDLTFLAIQGKDTVSVQASLKWSEKGVVAQKVVQTGKAGSKVEGSEYCLDCESIYLIRDGKGGTEVKTEGYNTTCCPCGSIVKFSDGYNYEIVCQGDQITAKMKDKGEE